MIYRIHCELFGLLNKNRLSTVAKAYLIQLDDVRVADLLQDFDLSRNPLNVFLVFDLFLLKDLDSDLKPIVAWIYLPSLRLRCA